MTTSSARRRVVIACLVAITTPACTTSTTDHPQPTTATPSATPTATDLLTVQRPEYPTVPDGVADPAAAITGPHQPVVTYRGEPVAQACNLLTIEDLRATGALPLPQPLPGGISRHYFDGQGPAELPIDHYLLPTEVNDCSYPLLAAQTPGVVILEVYQPTYTGPGALHRHAQTYHPQPAIGDVTITAADGQDVPFTNGGRWLLQHQQVIIRLTVAHPDPAVKQAILTTVATKLTSLNGTPTGPHQIRYDSPTFPGDYANACEVTGNDDFRTIFGIDAGPIAAERASNAIGIIKFTTHAEADDRHYNYIASECTRTSAAARGEQQTLVIQIDTYETPEPAVIAFQHDRRDGTDQHPVTTRIGDDTALYSTQPSLTHALSFRLGRLVIRLSYYSHNTAIDPPTKRIDALTAVAHGIAERLTEDGGHG